jgi:xanthine dehydrogenase accessory factor
VTPEGALQAWLAQGGSAVRVAVVQVEGSGPREVGAWMALRPGAQTPAVPWLGTIGGGHLEHEALAHAAALLAGQALPLQRRFALGPSLGQCCGGVVLLQFEPLTAADLPRLAQDAEKQLATRMPVALFGGGHVGRAIVQALLPLPVRVQWVDSREEIFPLEVPAHIQAEHSEPVHAAVAALVPQSRVLIMSFSHAEDLDVVAQCLKRRRSHSDLPFIGLIGSRTKWATFRHRLEARGFTADELAAVTCPIGVPGVSGKEPAVIAAAVVAQLMQWR